MKDKRVKYAMHYHVCSACRTQVLCFCTDPQTKQKIVCSSCAHKQREINRMFDNPGRRKR